MAKKSYLHKRKPQRGYVYIYEKKNKNKNNGHLCEMKTVNTRGAAEAARAERMS